jgi:hypothetical protein
MAHHHHIIAPSFIIGGLIAAVAVAGRCCIIKGGSVIAGRVNGQLAVSRALGDHALKRHGMYHIYGSV